MEAPIARGIHICEQVIIEEGSRNASLINTFSRRVWNDPFEQIRFVVYCVLCGRQGTIPLQVLVSSLVSGEQLFNQTVPFTFLDPIANHRMIYRFTELQFPEPGFYEVAILTDGDPITSNRIELFERA